MSTIRLQYNLLCVFCLDENVIGLSLQEILPDNNIKAEKMLVSNPPNILKRAKALKMENAVSKSLCFLILHQRVHANHSNRLVHFDSQMCIGAV